jgi:tetratricopeptide (TPR) repeat protein
MSKYPTTAAAFLLFVLVCAITAAIYTPGLAGDYMFDDMPNLLNNKRLQIDSLSLESLQSAALSSGAGILRRPVSMLSFALNRYFFGVAPFSYKTVNLAIHLLTGLGLFLLSRMLLRAYRLCHKPELPDSTITWLPVIVSGLWLVHPLNLTPVLYIVQRMTSLTTLFMVCGLCLYTAGRLRILARQRGLALMLTGLLVFGTLAIFSKENGALLPLFMLVVEMTLFRFKNDAGHYDRRVVVFFLVTVAVPAIVFLLYLAIHPGVILGGYNGRAFSLSERLLTESRVLVFYLKMIIAPSISELGLYHDDIALSHGLLDPPATLYSLLTLSGLLAAAVLLLKKHPLISLGILWFFTGHLIESTVFPLEIAHEHRNYLADYGIILAAASTVSVIPLRQLAPLIKSVVPVLFFLLFASITWLRASQWSDNVNQAIYEARHHPNSFRAVFAAGRIHGRLAIQGHPDSVEKAYSYLERASELETIGIMSEVTKIKLAYILERPVDPGWFDKILDKLSRHPLTASDVDSLKELVACIGELCDIEPETMESIFSLALRHRNARVETIYGYYTINKRGNFDKGLALFRHAVELRPQEPQLWINLIKLLIAMKRPDEAQEQLGLFMTAGTHGGNDTDYSRLQVSIDNLRRMQASPEKVSIPGNR